MAKSYHGKTDKVERGARLARKQQKFRDTEQQELRNVNRLGFQWDASGTELDEEDDYEASN